MAKIRAFFNRNQALMALVGEALIFAAVLTGCYFKFLQWSILNSPVTAIDNYTIAIYAVFIILGMLVNRAWKDFARVFLIGRRPLGVFPLKNTVEAISLFQRLSTVAMGISLFIDLVILFEQLARTSLENLEAWTFAWPLTDALLPLVYYIIISYFILPLRFIAQIMNNNNNSLDSEKNRG